MALGKRLKECREGQGVTQQEMADACGLSRNYLSAMERGVNKCNANTLITYARVLNMSIDEIVWGEKGRTHKGDSIIPDLKRALKDMPEDEQKKVLRIIEIIKS